MNWNLEGRRVSGKYLGAYPFTGVVVNSRVKYGGRVQHTVALDSPMHVFGDWRDQLLYTDYDSISSLQVDEQFELDTENN